MASSGSGCGFAPSRCHPSQLKCDAFARKVNLPVAPGRIHSFIGQFGCLKNGPGNFCPLTPRPPAHPGRNLAEGQPRIVQQPLVLGLRPMLTMVIRAWTGRPRQYHLIDSENRDLTLLIQRLWVFEVFRVGVLLGAPSSPPSPQELQNTD